MESGESDHKSLTVFIYKYFSLRDAEDISKMKRLHFHIHLPQREREREIDMNEREREK